MDTPGMQQWHKEPRCKEAAMSEEGANNWAISEDEAGDRNYVWKA
jgi:hypothetical protein